jgi:hypothetical protein
MRKENSQMHAEMVVELESNYTLNESGPVVSKSDKDTWWLRLKLQNSSNITLISPPFSYQTAPRSDPRASPMVKTVEMVKAADIHYLRKKLSQRTLLPYLNRTFMDKWIFRSSTTVPNPRYQGDTVEGSIPGTRTPVSLTVLALRASAEYNRIFGELGGKPHVTSSMEGLYEKHKLATTVLGMSRSVANITEEMKRTVIPKFDEALDRLYHAMGTQKFMRTRTPDISAHCLAGMSLSASNGIFPGEVREVVHKDGKLVISPRGRKYENFEQVREELWKILETRSPIPVYWLITPKSENKFKLEFKDEKEFETWTKKLRVFVIPSSIFIMAERMITMTRKAVETGDLIMIGHKWARGGADEIAKKLRQHPHQRNKRKVVLGDGDFKNLDLTIHQILVRLYFSAALVYYKKGSIEYEMMKFLVDEVVRSITVRITHAFNGMWAYLVGGVPSGVYNTSHMDSYIVAFLYFLFIACTLPGLSVETANEIEHMFYLREGGLIVYGDDHIIFVWATVAAIVGETAFAEWISRVWCMEIKDIHTDIPFESQVRNGEIIEKGVVFLKQYFVRNPDAGHLGQAHFLPFRPKSEVCIRAVWGREPGIRDPVDVLLSCLGHAYCTMGSNYDAWLWLSYLYAGAVQCVNEIGWSEVKKRALQISVRKLRQFGVTSDDMLNGYPTIEELQSRNKVDEAYHFHSHDIDFEVRDSSLIRETTENESANAGYKFGQEEETYNIVAAHGYFGRLIFQYASFNNSRSLHFFLAAWPVIGIWFTALGLSTMAFNLNGLNFNQSVVDSQGRVLNTWADIINRANLGMEVMHERNAHNFPLDLASVEAPALN